MRDSEIELQVKLIDAQAHIEALKKQMEESYCQNLAELRDLKAKLEAEKEETRNERKRLRVVEGWWNDIEIGELPGATLVNARYFRNLKSASENYNVIATVQAAAGAFFFFFAVCNHSWGWCIPGGIWAVANILALTFHGYQMNRE